MSLFLRYSVLRVLSLFNDRLKRSIIGTERSFVPVGVDGGEGPPVPIPNTVVKLVCVENTWWVTAREDR